MYYTLKHFAESYVLIRLLPRIYHEDWICFTLLSLFTVNLLIEVYQVTKILFDAHRRTLFAVNSGSLGFLKLGFDTIFPFPRLRVQATTLNDALVLENKRHASVVKLLNDTLATLSSTHSD
jgi:hypothetical protein